MNTRTIQKFQKEILTYYKEHKRRMPWRDISNPYKIFISEMMLQQTQVSRVKIKYKEFIKRFPTITSIAEAEKNEILKTWQGLGYNRRALFIKRTCEEIISKYKGIFPKDIQTLQSLPGIGPSTASAICAFAYNKPVFFIETNIRAVILHFFFKKKKYISDKKVLEILKKVSPIIRPQHLNGDMQIKSSDTHPYKNNATIPVSPRDWYYAMYDYGTFLKKNLGKEKIKLHQQSKHYTKQSKFEGSFRQKRAQVLKLKLNSPTIHDSLIVSKLNILPQELEDILYSLTEDGLL